VIMGNGPIKMSLKDAEKKTKERKDEDEGGYKSQFKFAPSAELPPEPKITAETYRGAPIAEHIVDVGMAGETLWSPQTLEFIRDNLEMYTNVEKQTGVAWEIIAALHYREASMGMANPANGQGVFQLYSSGAFFKPGPVTKEEFTRQAVLAANLMKEKAKGGAVQGELSLSNPDKVKDTLFSYNGRAAQYGQQAKALGYNLPAEGSPYVMNLADDARNSNKNSNWGQILIDNGPLGKANQAPGAWVLIDGLMRIEQKAHDQAVAKQQAEAQEFEAKKAAERKAAEEEKQRNQRPTSEVEPFTAWHDPVPAGITTSSQFGIRGYDAAGNPIMHTGIDFGAGMGTPFYAAAGGTVSVFVSGDVRSEAWCQKAIAGTGNGMNVVKDPYQKEVHVTTKIGNDTYVTIYAHMSEVSVAPGQIVKAGEALGKTGNSGCSTGPHAHFEVRKNGVPIDPNTILGGAIQSSSSEIKAEDDGHSHDDHEHGVGATAALIDAPVAEIKLNIGEAIAINQSADEGLLKIDHSIDTLKIPDVTATNNNPNVEQTVSQAIEKARLTAAISNAALERARNNDKALVK
ncbi:MAG TPA: M23 family metallopeptidase, partial [Candidatus Saccharimonadales bacterium]